MINIAEKTVTMMGKTEPIVEFRVIFQTPVGLIENLDDAIRRMAALDLDPAFTIRPVSIAVTASSYEVCGS